MAVVLASIAFWAPVVLMLPGDDDKAVEIKFRARYKRLPKSEREALDMRSIANNITPEARKVLEDRANDPKARSKDKANLLAQLAAEPITDEEYLDVVLVDWDLKDKDGEPIHFTPASRAEQVEALDGLEAALIWGYVNARRAATDAGAVAKNSGKPSGTR